MDQQAEPIEYHWSYEVYPGEGFVTFELSSKVIPLELE